MENNKALFQSIFNRDMEDAGINSYLESIATTHPYFSPAQFYLLLQAKKTNPTYKKQIQKTTALFNNKYWLNYLLTISTKQEPLFIESFFGNGETISDSRTKTETAIETIEEETEGSTDEQVIIDPVDENTKEAKMNNGSSEAFVKNEPAPENQGLTLENEVEENFLPYDVVSSEERPPATDQPVITKDEFVANYIDKTIAEGNEDISLATEETNNERTGESSGVSNESTSFSTNESEAENVTKFKNGIEGITPIADTQEEAMLFQPLHTSDYFASVGIKLSEDANASDRLGKQLKSFTQWLKTMKKIDAAHAEPLLPVEIASENIDSNIQKLAEISNKDDGIITEAMADVLVQQGRLNKAIEVLKKLSLLNPSKSTYFAAKIEQLKD